ncbi:MAG TPA: hypothetical protein VMF10_16355 [Candidatus Aquilonibacter sp.]|nr:hypothetical protein [Candidatus Aquilonibacter sp.]
MVDKSLRVVRSLKIRAVNLPDRDKSGRPLTRCDGLGHPAVIDLILGSQVSTTDQIQVFIYADKQQTKQLFASDGKLSFTATSFPTFTATPQAAPGESLNNGATRDVGQLNVAFADQNLFGEDLVDIYAKSTDLFSTDAEDAKSAFGVTGGFQRGLFSRWYSPYHLEQTIQGNQMATNLSTATTLGFNTLPPWHWTASGLNNGVIDAPLPFEPAIAVQYVHRFEQLVTKKTPLLSENDFTVNPALSWSNISFPFVCKLFNHRKTTAEAPGTPAPVCLGAQLDLGLWYLPLDLTASKSERVDGYGDASILIPLSDFGFASTALSYVTKGDPMKFQLRITYADSVNAANNYARTRQWTFGIEALK